MKTKNNVQKAISKSLAVVISFVLLSFTVNAQNFWKTLLENNSFNEIAMAMTETGYSASKMKASSSTDADAFAALLETETEQPMELEAWMTDNDFFSSHEFYIEEETDQPLELESWMTNDIFFHNYSISFALETEEPLELENWMLNFDVNETEDLGNEIYSNFSIENEMEKVLKPEPLMTINNYWK